MVGWKDVYLAELKAVLRDWMMAVQKAALSAER